MRRGAVDMYEWTNYKWAERKKSKMFLIKYPGNRKFQLPLKYIYLLTYTFPNQTLCWWWIHFYQKPERGAHRYAKPALTGSVAPIAPPSRVLLWWTYRMDILIIPQPPLSHARWPCSSTYLASSHFLTVLSSTDQQTVCHLFGDSWMSLALRKVFLSLLSSSVPSLDLRCSVLVHQNPYNAMMQLLLF